MARVVAAIMAGGEGRRFRPYTDLIPKPMVPVGPEEKPLLEIILRWLKRHGVEDFVFLLGYRWRQVINYFDAGDRWGVRIRFTVDDDEYQGTGGALVKALREGLLDADTILVWYGDILAPLDVSALLENHMASGAASTVAVASRYKVPVGVAELDDELNVVSLREKPWVNLHVTIGVLAVEKRLVEWAAGRLGKRFDIMGDMLPHAIREGWQVKAYIHRGPWFDVGSWERYQKLDLDAIKEILEA